MSFDLPCYVQGSIMVIGSESRNRDLNSKSNCVGCIYFCTNTLGLEKYKSIYSLLLTKGLNNKIDSLNLCSSHFNFELKTMVETTGNHFQKCHGNSQIIRKSYLWRGMIVCVFMRHGI